MAIRFIQNLADWMLGREKARNPPPSETIQGRVRHNVMWRFPQIADIKEIKAFKDLPLGSKRDSILLIEDFKHEDISRYTREKKNAELLCEIGKEHGLRGNGLRIHYSLKPVQDHRGVDISRKFILEEGLQDWSAYTYLNVVAKVQQVTSLFRLCIVELDGDWWNFINNEILDPDVWYWIRIPIREMYIMEDFSIQGNGKQDFTQVAELRFLFDGTNIGQSPLENSICIDCVFLSR